MYRKLGRNMSHRLSLLKTMVSQLFEKGKIRTTISKAIEVRNFAEKIISKAKVNSLHTKRQLLGKIRNEDILKKIFDVILPSCYSKTGGNVRVLKLGKRKGDAAEMAVVELLIVSKN